MYANTNELTYVRNRGNHLKGSIINCPGQLMIITLFFTLDFTSSAHVQSIAVAIVVAPRVHNIVRENIQHYKWVKMSP